MGSPPPPADPFQTEVARLALSAAKDHGFALGGGHALIAHGIVHRATEDVDLFTDLDSGVPDATAAVLGALSAAGLEAELIPETSELGEVFYGFDTSMAEFEVVGPGRVTRLSLARLHRLKPPVTMVVGPVLDLEDVIGSKLAALITRGQPRDYMDIAAALKHFGVGELLAMGARSDPSLPSHRRAHRVDAPI